jgi:rRNA maturation endonuclease Nob1
MSKSLYVCGWCGRALTDPDAACPSCGRHHPMPRTAHASAQQPEELNFQDDDVSDRQEE